jgi:ATP-dependent helicase/DNAse subunit B
LDVLQRGLVYHAILEETYREIKAANMTITPDNQQEALAILQDAAQSVLRDAPTRYRFRASALWDEEQEVIKRRLYKLVEKDFSPQSPLHKFGGERVPFATELKFGFPNSQQALIPTSSGEMLRVRGSIDRIDRIGNRLVVVDYKSGGNISVKDMEEGRNFQMMVYLQALDHIIKLQKWSYKVGGGLFWRISDQTGMGAIAFTVSVDNEPAIQQAQEHLTRYLKQMREGNFTVQPTAIKDGKCASYCDYFQLCRLANTQQYKDGVY